VPVNRLERIAFVLLCIVAGALLVVTALVFGGVIAEDPAAAVKPKQPAAMQTALVVTASRGECRLEVRRGSPTGPVRYSATLAAGQSVRLPGSRFWIRFGAASNVDVTIGGKPVDLPSGTVDLVVSGPAR